MSSIGTKSTVAATTVLMHKPYCTDDSLSPYPWQAMNSRLNQLEGINQLVDWGLFAVE
jgi:hypothetical protein